MSRTDPIDIDVKSAPFDQLRSIYRLSKDRSGLGAVLYTFLAGHGSTWDDAVGACARADGELDPELKHIVWPKPSW